MKKKMIITTAMTLTLLGLAAGCGGSDIGEAKAKEIALQDAGVSESDISRFQSSKDRDDGRTLYEIQLHLTIRNMNTRSTQKTERFLITARKI